VVEAAEGIQLGMVRTKCALFMGIMEVDIF
jgi:hypothetical protein